MLLEIGAVGFQPEEPFTLASGLKSPVYIDCRQLISFPRIRSTLMNFATDKIYRHLGYEQFDGVAGGETAGIPFAAWIAERMGLPMQYVRKKPKGYGKDAQIEGVMKSGDRVLLVEDLATDGGSKVNFIRALRTAEAVAHHAFVIFYYDIFASAQEELAREDMKLLWLATWADVLNAAKEGGNFEAETLNQVGVFLEDPLAWSEERGGNYQPPIS